MEQVKTDQEAMNEQIRAISKLVAMSLTTMSSVEFSTAAAEGNIHPNGCCGTFGTATDTFGTFGCYSPKAISDSKI